MLVKRITLHSTSTPSFLWIRGKAVPLPADHTVRTPHSYPLTFRRIVARGPNSHNKLYITHHTHRTTTTTTPHAAHTNTHADRFSRALLLDRVVCKAYVPSRPCPQMHTHTHTPPVTHAPHIRRQRRRQHRPTESVTPRSGYAQAGRSAARAFIHNTHCWALALAVVGGGVLAHRSRIQVFSLGGTCAPLGTAERASACASAAVSKLTVRRRARARAVSRWLRKHCIVHLSR